VILTASPLNHRSDSPAVLAEELIRALSIYRLDVDIDALSSPYAAALDIQSSFEPFCHGFGDDEFARSQHAWNRVRPPWYESPALSVDDATTFPYETAAAVVDWPLRRPL